MRAGIRIAAIALALSPLALPEIGLADPSLPGLVGGIRPDSQLIGCDRAAERIVLRRSAHLDRTCEYTGGFELTRSDLVLDCRGATISDPEGDDDSGVLVHGGTNFAIRNTKVRNCIIRGFENNFRVTRDGFRSLAAGTEYRNAYSRIELRNSRILDARGHGIYIDGYVTGVSIRDVEVADSAGAGIFLQSGSRNNKIIKNYIHDNGYGDVDPVNGTPFFVSGIEFRYLSTGREGISLDGSSRNRIVQNTLERNSYGGIHLHKSCGEFVNEEPDEWFPRRSGSADNRIRRNHFIEEEVGIWVGSRMSQNQLLRDCSATPFISAPGILVYEDSARGNKIQSNLFENVGIGVRVEDDFTRVERNTFRSDDSRHSAIVIGTRHRTQVLDQPVRGPVILGNRSDIFLNPSPYNFVYGVDALRFQRNRNQGYFMDLHQAQPPPLEAHLFFREFWVP